MTGPEWTRKSFRILAGNFRRCTLGKQQIALLRVDVMKGARIRSEQNDLETSSVVERVVTVGECLCSGISALVVLIVIISTTITTTTTTTTHSSLLRYFATLG